MHPNPPEKLVPTLSAEAATRAASHPAAVGASRRQSAVMEAAKVIGREAWPCCGGECARAEGVEAADEGFESRGGMGEGWPAGGIRAR